MNTVKRSEPRQYLPQASARSDECSRNRPCNFCASSVGVVLVFNPPEGLSELLPQHIQGVASVAVTHGNAGDHGEQFAVKRTGLSPQRSLLRVVVQHH